MKHLFSIILCFFLVSCTQKNPVKVDYISEPCLIPASMGKWKLCDNMIVHVDNTYHVVPMGFKTDLASIPRPLWWLYSPTDFDSIASSVLHDWHYCCSKEVSRAEADNIFYYGLRSQGMPESRALIYYYSVRYVGWMFYTKGKGIFSHIKEFSENEIQGVYQDVNYTMG